MGPGDGASRRLLGRIGLRAKMFWVITLLVTGLAGVLAALSLFQLRQSMEDDLAALGAAAVMSLAKDSQLGLFAENPEFITPLFSALKGERSFLYAAVYQPGMKLLADSAATAEAETLLRQAAQPPAPERLDRKPLVRHLKVNGVRVVEWWAPVYGADAQPDEMAIVQGSAATADQGELIGIVRLGLSPRHIEQALNENLARTAAALAAFLILALISAYALAAKVTGRLLRLVTASEAVALGDLDQHIRMASGDEVGKLSGAFNRMIDAVKERDAQLRKAHDELEARVRERTAELSRTNEKLHEEIAERERTEIELADTARNLAKHAAELEKSNQELDQFAYVAAHDLKAPLRAIASLATWIEEDLQGQLSGETRQHMDTLKGRVRRLENLINGILQYARIGNLASTEVTTVETRELVAQITDMLAPPPGFRIEIDPGLPALRCVRTLLEQVFFNLIGNAIKYHHRPDGHVRIGWARRGSRIEFTVADDGPGIAPQFHEKIFTIFQTLHARDSIESTGIGLALVKKIVESQGGAIAVESDEGRGAVFRFTWPIEPSAG